MNEIGFMQGRLSLPIDGKIQAFPVKHWREEFSAAKRLGFNCMEWTLDHEDLEHNPLMTSTGQSEIRTLSAGHGIAIPSLTGDCFMQAPFWKTDDPRVKAALLGKLDSVLQACAVIKIGVVVVPLVDHSRIETSDQEALLRESLVSRAPSLRSHNIKVAFETDLPPEAVATWIAGYPEDVFGINYDTGNSASLGFDPEIEWRDYGHRILNVHIKDRPRNGITVPLGQGACNFKSCFRTMTEAGYSGNFILQTARAPDGDHAGVLARYRDYVADAWTASGEEKT